MKFAIAVNMDRVDPKQPMGEVVANCLELVTMADQGGFEVAWAAEHHGVELTVGPNPFQQLVHWGHHTSHIRLGTGVIVAPYWHPIRVAGEAGLADLYTDGRIELGFGRGAFQYEFNRMANGIAQVDGGTYLREMVPLLKALWAGDVEHEGECWSFPKATALPKPIQSPHPPLWVAARGEDTFDFAMQYDMDIMSTPLGKPFSEVEDLARKYREAVAAYPDRRRPRFMVMRRGCVYAEKQQRRTIVEASYAYERRFDGLFSTDGTVIEGFPQPMPDPFSGAQREARLEANHDAMLFGTPDEVVEKLAGYRDVGVDLFCLNVSFDLPQAIARRSLELFITEVMPHFREERSAPLADAG